ncbi:unnamed protein product [Adineta ricciae]|uniref:Uncharacterized protein n=1 Tax=Adineta ricciae TaxID=249248 RepID=A0A816ET31_ADIRI|nr:unnamed protein product [Adineta ricciae]
MKSDNTNSNPVPKPKPKLKLNAQTQTQTQYPNSNPNSNSIPKPKLKLKLNTQTQTPNPNSIPKPKLPNSLGLSLEDGIYTSSSNNGLSVQALQDKNLYYMNGDKFEKYPVPILVIFKFIREQYELLLNSM